MLQLEQLTITFYQDISKVSVEGLKDKTFIDKVQGGAKDTETRDRVTVSSEVDRVYCNAPDSLRVDLGNGQSIGIEKVGLKDTGKAIYSVYIITK